MDGFFVGEGDVLGILREFGDLVFEDELVQHDFRSLELSDERRVDFGLLFIGESVIGGAGGLDGFFVGEGDVFGIFR